MKKILNINFFENYLYIYILVLFFSFFYVEDKFISELLPYEEISISSFDKKKTDEGNYIVILGVEEKNSLNMEQIFLKNIKLKENTEGLSFIKKGNQGYTTDVIYTTNSKNKINLNVKKSLYTKIVFYNIGISKQILIEFPNPKKNMGLNFSVHEVGEVIEYFPFKESKIIVLYYFIFYSFVAVLIFFLTFLLFCFLEKIKERII